MIARVLLSPNFRALFMLSSDKKATVVFVVYAVVQLFAPIALFRGTLEIKDALWFVGTITPVVMGTIVLAWYVLARSHASGNIDCLLARPCVSGTDEPLVISVDRC